MRIAYILDLFPVISETFIVREILELKQNGIFTDTFSLKNTQGTQFSEVVHSDSEKLYKKVIFLPNLLIWGKAQLFCYHLYFFIRKPLNYMRTLFFAYRHSENTFSLFKASVLIAKELKKYGTEHLHAHFALQACKMAMLISLITDIPYSFTIHAHDIFRPDLSDLVEEKFKNAKFIVSISHYNKNFILEKYPHFDSRKIKIIHCGIGIPQYTISSDMDKNVFSILSVGRLVEQKGFKYLIQACDLLKRNYDFRFSLSIIGEGKQRKHLEKMIGDFKLNDFIYLQGAMDQGDVLDALRSATVFVLPCVVESNYSMDGIPVALMEAMTVGVPVISTNISGIPELVKNGGGILIEAENANQLAEAIFSVYSLKYQERQAMIMRAREIVENEFSQESEAKKLAMLFQT